MNGEYDFDVAGGRISVLFSRKLLPVFLGKKANKPSTRIFTIVNLVNNELTVKGGIACSPLAIITCYSRLHPNDSDDIHEGVYRAVRSLARIVNRAVKKGMDKKQCTFAGVVMDMIWDGYFDKAFEQGYTKHIPAHILEGLINMKFEDAKNEQRDIENEPDQQGTGTKG